MARGAAFLLAAWLALACPPALARLAASSSAPDPTPATAAGEPAPFAAARLRFGGGDDQTRMVLEVDHAVSAKVRPAQTGAARLVLVLSDLTGAPAAAGAGLGLIKAWTLSPDGAGSRLTLDLVAPGLVAHRFLLPPKHAGGPYRYVVDVTRPPVPARGSVLAAAAASTAAAFSSAITSSAVPPDTQLSATAPPPETARPARHGRARAATRLAQIVAARRVRRVVVIDPGHGGHDPGAQSAGADEKDITLAAGRDLAQRLERTGRYKVVMTRDSDVFIPLEERVRIARRAGADLFVSLHADSAGPDPDVHGASVYTLSDHGETRVTQVLGPHEWFSGAARRAADPGVGQILLDLTQHSTLDRSCLFAGILVDHVRGEADLLPRSRRDAGYFVLLAPDVPAALLEMGFISSPKDQARLIDPVRRGRLMDAVAQAIDAYFLGEPGSASRS